MNNFHDPIKHIKYLRQALSQDKKQIGFFLSAGCPLAVTLPDPTLWPLIPDIRNLTLKINNTLKSAAGSTPNNYDKLLEQTKIANKNIENIEDILSFIRGLRDVAEGGNVRGFSESDLNTLEKDVCETIVGLLNVSLPDKSTPYHHLANWISIDREKPIEIFTTNYDLLLEQAFEDNAIPYFDGFVGSRFPFFDLRAIEDDLIPKHWTRLWKIHGSINWLQNNNVAYRSSYSDNYKDAYLIYPSHLKYNESRKMPYLALIDQLNKFIRSQSPLLIFCGYSFNDEHLNNTIISALKSNPTATAIALMYDSATIEISGVKTERYANAINIAKQRSNLSVWTFDEAIIGTLRGEWKLGKPFDPEENIGNCIEIKTKTITGDPNPVSYPILKLGDFDIMGKFLQELIGLNQHNSDEPK